MTDPAKIPLRDLTAEPCGWPSTLTLAHPPGLYLHQRDSADPGELVVVTDYGGDAYLTSGEALGPQCFEPPHVVTPVRMEWREVRGG